jgi:segregation and condensation protein B
MIKEIIDENIEEIIQEHQRVLENEDQNNDQELTDKNNQEGTLINNETNMHHLKMFIEAALLASDQPLTIEQLKQLIDEHERPTTHAVRDALNQLAADCENRGIELAEVASGFRFQIKALFNTRIGKLWQERPPRYSRALLETLALIAYRQPITRAEIEDIRGVVVSTHIIKILLEREWVRVVGHRDVPGKPALYATTRQFLDYFNMKSLSELPTLTEIQNLDHLAEQLEAQGNLNVVQIAQIEHDEFVDNNVELRTDHAENDDQDEQQNIITDIDVEEIIIENIIEIEAAVEDEES